VVASDDYVISDVMNDVKQNSCRRRRRKDAKDYGPDVGRINGLHASRRSASKI